jgi:hypothetical protein
MRNEWPKNKDAPILICAFKLEKFLNEAPLLGRLLRTEYRSELYTNDFGLGRLADLFVFMCAIFGR